MTLLKYHTTIFLFLILAVFGVTLISFNPSQKFKYHFKVDFPPTATIFQDTTYSGAFSSDCPSTILFRVTANNSTSKFSYLETMGIGPSNVMTLNLMDGSNKPDTISHHLCLGLLTNDFFERLTGKYNFNCYPANKVFRPFQATLLFNPQKDRGRRIDIALGNYQAAYTFQITASAKLSKKELQMIKDNYWTWWINPNLQENDSVPEPKGPLADKYNFMFLKHCSIKLIDRRISEN
jgi:hypothetical protein